MELTVYYVDFILYRSRRMKLILPIKRKGIVIWILNLLSLLFMQARQYFKASNNSKMVFQITQKLNNVHIQLTIKMSLLLHMLKVWFLNSLKIIEYILCMLFFCLSARNNLTCKKHTVTLIWRQLRVLSPGKNLRCFLGMHCHFIL